MKTLRRAAFENSHIGTSKTSSCSRVFNSFGLCLLQTYKQEENSSMILHSKHALPNVSEPVI